MYRDIHFSEEKQAIVTTSGVVVVPNIKSVEESFPLLNCCGELEKRLEADRAANGEK
ncbi:MAG: hypothetical protein M0R80_07705 [Proteobacteria bacterium]|jgi:hypothetical protein|nr:hypothetical protein [Pseudomonadota bacterium]